MGEHVYYLGMHLEDFIDDPYWANPPRQEPKPGDRITVYVNGRVFSEGILIERNDGEILLADKDTGERRFISTKCHGDVESFGWAIGYKDEI